MTSRRQSASELSRLEQRALARRLLIDGIWWLVYELADRDLDRRSGHSLVFESETTVRRVRDFPSHWRTLSNEELAKLSWGR